MPSSTCKSKACIKRKLFLKKCAPVFPGDFQDFCTPVPTFQGVLFVRATLFRAACYRPSDSRALRSDGELNVLLGKRGETGVLSFFPSNSSPALSLSKHLEQAIFGEALLMDTLVSGQLYLRPPSQNPVLLNSHTNFLFLHSRKRPAPVTDTFVRVPRESRAHESFLCIRIWIDPLTKAPGNKVGMQRQFSHWWKILKQKHVFLPTFTHSGWSILTFMWKNEIRRHDTAIAHTHSNITK